MKPDWSQYKFVPESVLIEELKKYWANLDFYIFMSGGNVPISSIDIVKLARPKMDDEDIEKYELDLYIWHHLCVEEETA